MTDREERDALIGALAKCVAALRRARHTRHNVMSFKDYWTRHAQPACAHAEAVYDRARARRVLAATDGEGARCGCGQASGHAGGCTPGGWTTAAPPSSEVKGADK